MDDIDDIFPIPLVPPGIIEAVSNNRLVIFIGAGTSRIIGCDGWKELAKKLVNAAHEQEVINYHEKSRIIEKYGPRETITILKKILPEGIYEETLRQSLKGDDEKKKKRPIYEKLFKLRGIYLTTNIDTHFDRHFEKSKIFSYPSQLSYDRIKPFSLFHLHGTMDDFSTVIFSVQEYISHYNKENIKEFLKYIFTEFTVLFVGYSLSEREILDYLLLKGNPVYESEEKQKKTRHFILLPLFGAEKNLLRFEKEYFSELNVSVVPYAIDEKGYDQLYDVIESWESYINRKTSFVPKSFGFIEQNIDHYDKQNAVEIFQLIKNDEYFGNHFFGKVKSVDWFYPLRNKCYFSPENAPGPKAAGKEGYYTIPQWNVLPYLERVSQQVNVPGNERYIDELLTIIKDVSSYRDASGKHISNYRTWWYFTKILLNIPNRSIPLEIVNLIPIWLDSTFDVILPGSEIANNLLPKFLPDNPTEEDVQKAERIVDYVTAVKVAEIPAEWEPDIRYEREEPPLIVDTFWLIDSFIKQKNADRVGEKCTEKLIHLIADRLKTIFRYQKPVHQINIDLEDRIYNISVLHTRDYKFVFRIRISEKQSKDEESLEFDILECKNFEFFLESVRTEISKFAEARKIEEIDTKLRLLYESLFHDYSFIWFRSLSIINVSAAYETRKVLTLILRNILLAKARVDKLATQDILDEFLGDRYQYPIFKRLVLLTISEYWNDFREEFWKIISEPEGEKLFDDYNYEPEIYTLLEKNVKEFSSQEKDRIKQIIEKGPQRDLPKDNRDIYVNYWKEKWYSALKTDPDFGRHYQMYRDKTKTEERISFRETTVKVGPGPSPLTKEKILKMSNEGLAEFLSEFKTKDPWHGPTVDGLSDTLREVVREKPEKFVSNLSPFLNTDYYYVYSILWGIIDAWDNRKPLEWGNLFDFIKQYIERDEFWQDKFKMVDHDIWNADHQWVISMIGKLIQNGTKDSSWTFPEDYLPDAQEILFLILRKTKIRHVEEIGDPVNYALNSVFGKTITALIFLSWRIAQVEDEKGVKKKIKWSEEIGNEYEKMLKDGIVEAYILFGQYLHYLFALDRGWVEKKIVEFENIDEFLWSAFMSGYLINRMVYYNLYDLMGGHYLKAISYLFEEKYAEEGVVQHIALSYLYDVEDFSKNSLFGKLLKKWNPSQIQELISFFWMQRDRLTEPTGENVSDLNSDDTERLRNKILDFWRYFHEKYKEKDLLNEDDKVILSRVTLLSIFLYKIDEESAQWLMLSAPYVRVNHTFLFLVEYLDDLKDRGDRIESGRYIGKILLRMLNEFIVEFKDKHIRSIVRFLYETKEKEATDIANEICILYLSHGLEVLRDIYERYTGGESKY